MQPHEAATTPLREKFTPQGIELLVRTFLDLQHNVFQAAAQFGLTLAQLEEALAWPEARELIDRAQRLSALRTQPALDLIFPCALDRLAAVMFDEEAPAEVRRKSAALLARLCESRRRDRHKSNSAAPPKPTGAAPKDAPTPPQTSAPPEPTTYDDIAPNPPIAQTEPNRAASPNPHRANTPASDAAGPPEVFHPRFTLAPAPSPAPTATTATDTATDTS